jgi:hypothetical protein
MKTIDKKITELMRHTSNFVFMESYAHTGKEMYKVMNEYTHYAEEKIVLCAVDEGIEHAIDLAIPIMEEKKINFFN